MSWRRFFGRRQADAELKEEIESFLMEEGKENMARGMNREEAQRQAHVKFGNPNKVREAIWQQDTLAMVEGVWRDLKYAMRALTRSPGFALVAVTVMGLGIGASTSLFTVVHSVLLRPLPFSNPERLVMLYEHAQNVTPPYNAVAGGIFSEWRKASTSLEQMAIVSPWETYNVSGRGNQLPETVISSTCSWNLFSTLGVLPAFGRVFNAEEDRPEANATVVLSWLFWKRRFGGDPSILGQEISLDAKPYTVIGVMPAWFAYPGTSTQLWTPIYHEAPPSTMQALDNHQFFVVGRLKAGATLAQAVSGLDTVEKQIKQQYSSPGILGGVVGRSMLDATVDDYKRPLYVLLAATSCLLLIACLNVANLLIARSAARQREIAIRAALGSARWRLIREQLTESLVLAFIGGLLGLALANAAIIWLTHVSVGLPRAETIHIDWVALLFAAGATLVSGAAAGIVPALGLRTRQMLGSLQESSRSHSGGRNRARVRKILVGSEVGLTVVLLIAAGLLLKSYQKLRSTDMGCVMDNLLSLRVRLPDARYEQPARKTAIFEQLITRVRALPGVQAAGLVTAVPGQGWGGDGFISIVEHPPLPQGQTLDALFRGADPGYFAAIQIPVLRGRSFTDEERLDRSHVAIISQLAAKQFFPGEDPIGRHLILDKPGIPYEIVGVVGDTLYYVSEEVKPIVYWPIYSGDFGAATIALRSRSDVESFAVPVQKIVTEVDRDIPVSDVLTMRQLIGVSTVDASFVSTLILAFALAALVLASVGLYGVLSYLVTQRTSEIGIRIALGAQRSEVLGLMLLEGLTPAWIGLASGLVGACFTVQLIRSMLYATSALDWITFAEAALVLSSVAALACTVPAWRASRLDPMRALRTE